MPLQTVDVDKEIKAIKKASEQICQSKETALAYLKKHGFLNAEGKLADKYK